jgi:hypothetical protein
LAFFYSRYTLRLPPRWHADPPNASLSGVTAVSESTYLSSVDRRPCCRFAHPLEFSIYREDPVKEPKASSAGDEGKLRLFFLVWFGLVWF